MLKSVCLALVVSLLPPALLLAADAAKTSLAGYAYVTKEFPELNRMEFTADEARRQYWKGRYEEAAGQFGALARENHASTALYLNEKALCLTALGDYAAAAKDLQFAIQYMETFNTATIEKKALSSYGKEAEKIYFGDPYERALDWALLALIHLDRGDYDNALAACKSGLLADSDAMENRYQSDLVLLYVLEAKCHLLRGQPEDAAKILSAARENYRLTHPAVRSLFSARQDKIEIQRMSKKERRQLEVKDDDAAINVQISALDEQLRQAAQKVQTGTDLDLMLTGNFNTLILMPQGEAPIKMRRGAEANIVFFITNAAPVQPVELFLDGQPLKAGAVTNLCDVQFQATTRGGRQMDAILNKKAAYKKTTVGVGRTITEAGNAAGGLIGLAAALLGGAIQGAGGAISPEADTRCWHALPAEYVAYALDLPEGSHEVTASQFLYFEKSAGTARKFQLSGSNDFAFIYLPPPPVGRFSKQVLAEDPNRKIHLPKAESTASGQPIVLLPPPLGLGYIERFPSDNQKTRPLAFAPDPRRLSSLVQQALQKAHCQAMLVSHREAFQSRDRLATNSPAALQVELLALDFKAAGSDETYGVTLAFTLVDARTGASVFAKQARGSRRKPAKEKLGITDSFYQGCEQATAGVINDPQFTSALAALAQGKKE